MAASISATTATQVGSALRPSQLLARSVLLDRIRKLLEVLNAQNVPWELPKTKQVKTVASIAIPDFTVAKRA